MNLAELIEVHGKPLVAEALTYQFPSMHIEWSLHGLLLEMSVAELQALMLEIPEGAVWGVYDYYPQCGVFERYGLPQTIDRLLMVPIAIYVGELLAPCHKPAPTYWQQQVHNIPERPKKPKEQNRD